MSWFFHHLWLIPAAPLLAAGVTAVMPRRFRALAAGLAMGALVIALALSLGALVRALADGPGGRAVFNFAWFNFGAYELRLGWVLDPLSAVMLVMVSFVGLLIFIYSTGYLAKDDNYTRFFCFLALFAAAMLGLVIANSLLLLFICWELVGLASYLLIGFWFQKPAAAAAARKAFLTTRIGDLALLLGMVWLYARSGTLLFYDAGRGCLEAGALAALGGAGIAGLAAAGGIALLLFAGAIGKSGQLPLHVWLPDAMEGPTPVSALIHAATMVAAGVFLMARVYPLAALEPVVPQIIAWTGALTALFAASIAVAQTDLKRILAYSTVSQLGFMMLGLGAGGVAVAMFHLITHAFFKALLFLGAGSVIHSCHHEQDIRRLGGLRRAMPATFATYAVGMMAVSGVPLLFSGFWSKDAILHAAHAGPNGHAPFYLGLAAAVLTAFYMTRQMVYVFAARPAARRAEDAPAGRESPAVMTIPLGILALGAILPGFLGTPAWPWFQSFLSGQPAVLDPARLVEHGFLVMLAWSGAAALGGIAAGWLLYRRSVSARDPDVLQTRFPVLYRLLERKYFVDEAYGWFFGGLIRAWAKGCEGLDRIITEGLVRLAAYAVVGLGWVARVADEYLINAGFDRGCARLRFGGDSLARLQAGRAQGYLRLAGVGVATLILLLLWGCGAR